MDSGKPHGGAWKGVLALLLAVIVWGITFSVVSAAVEEVPPLHLVFYRFAIGSLVLYVILRRTLVIDPKVLRHSLLVGGMLAAAFAFQTWGLAHTTPARAAFITALSVLLVPLFGWWTRTERLRPGPLVGTLLAAVGLYLLFRGEGGELEWGRGELIVTGCALAFAGHILTIQRALAAGVPGLSLSLLQCVVVAGVTLPFLLIRTPEASHFTPSSLAALLGLGLIATPAFLLQVYAQKHLSASQTAVVLSLEPAMAAAFSVAVGMEPLTAGLVAGMSLLTGAVIVAEA